MHMITCASGVVGHGLGGANGDPINQAIAVALLPCSLPDRQPSRLGQDPRESDRLPGVGGHNRSTIGATSAIAASRSETRAAGAQTWAPAAADAKTSKVARIASRSASKRGSRCFGVRSPAGIPCQQARQVADLLRRRHHRAAGLRPPQWARRAARGPHVLNPRRPRSCTRLRKLVHRCPAPADRHLPATSTRWPDLTPCPRYRPVRRGVQCCPLRGRAEASLSSVSSSSSCSALNSDDPVGASPPFCTGSPPRSQPAGPSRPRPPPGPRG